MCNFIHRNYRWSVTGRVSSPLTLVWYIKIMLCFSISRDNFHWDRYLDQVLPRQYGIRKHPLFFLHCSPRTGKIRSSMTRDIEEVACSYLEKEREGKRERRGRERAILPQQFKLNLKVPNRSKGTSFGIIAC